MNELQFYEYFRMGKTQFNRITDILSHYNIYICHIYSLSLIFNLSRYVGHISIFSCMRELFGPPFQIFLDRLKIWTLFEQIPYKL